MRERSSECWSDGVNLKERAASQGISYATARRWHAAGTLRVAAYQVGG
jgi:putative resolvase